MDHEFVIDVSLGEVHTLVATKSGKLYSFGHNFYGQIGESGNEQHEKYPVLVKRLFDSRVVKVPPPPPPFFVY